MGSSSKVILVGATSLIVGVYAISLKKAETERINAALKGVERVQAERTSDAALRTALDAFVRDGGLRDKSGTMKKLDGGTFTYTIRGAGGASPRLTVFIVRDGKTKKITTTLHKSTSGFPKGPRRIHRGQWEVTDAHFEH